MKPFLLLALSICLVAGCSKGTGESADMDQAAPALRTALEAWKNGNSQQELESQTPSILMNEDDWREGKRLVDYKIEEPGSMNGRQVVFRVQIKLETSIGAKEERRAKYVIDTTPRIVIVRDRFAR